jgi:heme exporter protein D
LILTFLAVNLGEAMFFSLAGHGAYGWLMMAAGIMLGQRCVVVVNKPLARRNVLANAPLAITPLRRSFDA